MHDKRIFRHILVFLANVLSGVVTVLILFFSGVYGGPVGFLIMLVWLLVLGPGGWRSELKRRGRQPDQAKRVAREVLWVLIAWVAFATVFLGCFLWVAYAAMAPVFHQHKTEEVLFVVLLSAMGAAIFWFTWVRSRRILDLLWPLPGTAPGSPEPPYLQLKL